MSLISFYKAYVECAIWAEDKQKISDDCLQEMQDICEEFYANFNSLWDDDENAGHDLWLTQNRHGTGFWDKTKIYGEENAKKLTNAAHAVGEFYLY